MMLADSKSVITSPGTVAGSHSSSVICRNSQEASSARLVVLLAGEGEDSVQPTNATSARVQVVSRCNARKHERFSMPVKLVCSALAVADG